jgi:hypothetical protein
MSDSESGSSSDVEGLQDSMLVIHKQIEQLSHLSKHIYSKALQVEQRIENPDLDLWAKSFTLHERSLKWAKKHLVARKTSFTQIHKTLLESAKKSGRILPGHRVKLLEDEAEIMDLPVNIPVSVWVVLGKLPRFFV